MSGVAIVGQLLLAHAPLVDLIPPDSLQEDRLPDNVQLPALIVREISSVEWQALSPGAAIPTTDRVSVTVRARSSMERRAIILLVRAACADRVGVIAGFTGVSVRTAGRGPAVAGPADSFEQNQDFRVAFNAPA